VCIALHGSQRQSYGALVAILDHTVLPATRYMQLNAFYSNPSQTVFYLIYLPRRDGRLSWPGWLVIYQDGLPVQSPIGIEQLLWTLRMG